MDHQTMRNLRLDRRLIQRAGWIPEKELEAELDALPDVSAKVAPPEPAGGSGEPAEAGSDAGSGGESSPHEG